MKTNFELNNFLNFNIYFFSSRTYKDIKAEPVFLFKNVYLSFIVEKQALQNHQLAVIW